MFSKQWKFDQGKLNVSPCTRFFLDGSFLTPFPEVPWGSYYYLNYWGSSSLSWGSFFFNRKQVGFCRHFSVDYETVIFCWRNHFVPSLGYVFLLFLWGFALTTAAAAAVATTTTIPTTTMIIMIKFKKITQNFLGDSF